MAAPLRGLLATLPPEALERVDEEVLTALRERYDGRRVNLSATVRVATGVARGGVDDRPSRRYARGLPGPDR